MGEEEEEEDDDYDILEIEGEEEEGKQKYFLNRYIFHVSLFYYFLCLQYKLSIKIIYIHINIFIDASPARGKKRKHEDVESGN